VLIDDLVTKGTNEPYRMFTSRVEYRLVLREDNADLRLGEMGYRLQLVKKKDYKKICLKKKSIEDGLRTLSHTKIYPTKKTNDRLKKWNISPIGNASTMFDLLKRPQVSFSMLKSLDGLKTKLNDKEIKQIEIEVKYKGFIQRQKKEIENFKKIERIKIPDDFRFDNIPGLSNEISEKLAVARPLNLGHASRISGVTPVAISILMVYIKRWREDRWKKIQ